MFACCLVLDPPGQLCKSMMALSREHTCIIASVEDTVWPLQHPARKSPPSISTFPMLCPCVLHRCRLWSSLHVNISEAQRQSTELASCLCPSLLLLICSFILQHQGERVLPPRDPVLPRGENTTFSFVWGGRSWTILCLGTAFSAPDCHPNPPGCGSAVLAVSLQHLPSVRDSGNLVTKHTSPPKTRVYNM